MAKKNPSPDALATKLFLITLACVVMYLGAVMSFMLGTQGAVKYSEHQRPTPAEIQIASTR